MPSVNGANGSAHPLRVIMAGVGQRGASWVEAFAALDGWRPVALVDLDQSFLAAAREATGLTEKESFSSLADALARVEADTVSVVVPARLHAELIERALLAGKHVLVEKPFTTSLVDAERLTRLAAERERVVLVTQTARYARVSRTLQRLVAEERYGPLGFMTMTYHKPRPEPYPYSEHIHLYAQGVHELDTLCAIAGRPLWSVYGRSVRPSWSTWPSESFAEAMLTFGPRADKPDRAGPTGQPDLVYATYSGTSEARAPGYSFRLECAEAALVAGRGGGSIQAIRGRSSDDIALDELGYDNVDQHLARLFHQAITAGRGGAELETGARRNLETMRLTDAIIRSTETGQAVDLRSTHGTDGARPTVAGARA